MAKGGRKPAYEYEDPMFLLEIEGYARNGWDDKQIAEKLGLNETYFCTQKKKFPKLSEALKRGRRPLITIVENALLKRAMGAKYKTTIRKWTTIEGVDTPVEIVQETETEVPPDTGAAMAWLKHRDPKLWNAQPTKVAATDPSGQKAAPLLFLSADHLTEDQIQEYINKNIAGGDDDTETGDND